MGYRFAETGPLPNGRLSIWEEPVEGMSYALGYDAALGIQGGDSDAAVLLDLKGRQVACLHGHWGESITPYLKKLIDAYGAHRVFVVGEAASVGLVTLRQLYDAGGYWLYAHRAEDTKGRNVRDKLGHVPARNDITVRKLQEAIRLNKVEVRDEETHRQLCRFGYRPRNSSMSVEEANHDDLLVWGAPPGDHDDLVRATALAWAGIEWLPRYEPPKPKAKPGTIGHELKWDQEEEATSTSRWR